MRGRFFAKIRKYQYLELSNQLVFKLANQIYEREIKTTAATISSRPKFAQKRDILGTYVQSPNRGLVAIKALQRNSPLKMTLNHC